MNKSIINLVLFTVVSLCFTSAIKAQGIGLISHAILENNGQYGKLEIGFEMGGVYEPSPPFTYTNPYDPDQIRIVVRFTNATPPNYLVFFNDAFYYKDFKIDPMVPGNPWTGTQEFVVAKSTKFNFRARFSPPVAGFWWYTAEVYENNVLIETVGEDFTVAPTDNKGFIRRHPTNTNVGVYKFDNNTSYFPTGGNLNYLEQTKIKFLYSEWNDKFLGSINKITANDGNYCRLIISPYNNDALSFKFTPEWGANAILGDYSERQKHAYLLDTFFEHCHEKDVYLQLMIINFSEIDPTSMWPQNPLNQLALAHSYDILTDANAIKYLKRKLRYIMSRWGYSTNIFSWEMMGEVDHFQNQIPQSPSLNATAATWLYNLIDYCRTLDHNHMFNVSTYNDYFDTDLNSMAYRVGTFDNLDFIDHHTYGSNESYNVAYYRRASGLHKSGHFNKPFFSGEFGELKQDKFDLHLYNFDSREIYRENEVHNGLWQSSFSGQSGTSAFWFQHLYYRTISHFKPLRKLIDKIDFYNNDYISIINECGPGDTTILNMTSVEFNYFNDTSGYKDWFAENCNYDGPLSNISIQTYLEYGLKNGNGRLLVEGLKNDDQVYGWLHKKDNFWWKLPHASTGYNPNYGGNCPYIATLPSIPTPASCYNMPLENTRALFTDMCDGEYYIDYYSTYPQRSTTVGGPLVDGGIIPSFTRRIFSTNNTVNVKLPPLHPLSELLTAESSDITAPDYGYHLRKVKAESYKDDLVGSVSGWEQIYGDNLETLYRSYNPFTDHIFFEGKNDHLMHFYYYNGTWNHNLVSYSQPYQIAGDIAINSAEDKTFYRAAGGALNYWEWNGTGYTHECVSPGCSTPSNEEVAPDSRIEALDEQVFYKATDHSLNMYFRFFTSWQHVALNPNTVKLAGEEVGSDIEALDNDLTFTDSIFFSNTNGNIGLYTNAGNPSVWTFHEIGIAAVVDEQVAPNGHICPVNYDGQTYVFYIGLNGYPQYYMRTSTGWIHSYMTFDYFNHAVANSNLMFDDGVLYYAGTDGYIHRHYYSGGGYWGKSIIVPCPGDKPKSIPANFKFTAERNFIYTDLNPGNENLRRNRNTFQCEKCENAYLDNTDKALLRTLDNDQTRSLVNVDISAEDMKAYEAHNKIAEDVKKFGPQFSSFESEDRAYEVVIYPNPSTGFVNVVLHGSSETKLSLNVTNALGQKVNEYTVTNQRITVDLTGFTKGVYYFNLTTQTGMRLTTQKVTIY